jgi:hypothetical protein
MNTDKLGKLLSNLSNIITILSFLSEIISLNICYFRSIILLHQFAKADESSL